MLFDAQRLNRIHARGAPDWGREQCSCLHNAVRLRATTSQSDNKRKAVEGDLGDKHSQRHLDQAGSFWAKSGETSGRKEEKRESFSCV